MGRRRREEGDSLGLLLDPICNTFGGIIFLAMIISLLSHRDLHTAKPDGDASDVRLAAIDARRTRDRLAGELADTQARAAVERDTLKAVWGVEDVEQFNAVSQHVLPATQGASRVTDLIARLAAERAAADRRADAATASRVADARARAALQEKNRNAVAVLVATRFRTAADRSPGTAGHAVRLRTPLSHPTTKQQVALLLAHGRVYVPFKYEQRGRPTDPTPDCGPKMNDRDAAIGPGDLDNDHGADLSDPAAADRWVDAFVDRFSAQDVYIALGVWPDAHEAFARVRDRLVARGFDYQLLIEDRADEIHFGGHGDDHVQ